MTVYRPYNKKGDITQVLAETSDGRGYLVTEQEVDPILEDVKFLKDLHGGKSKNMRLKASVPMLLWYEWMEKYGPNFHQDQTLMRRLINGLEKGFRVDEGTL